MLKINMEFRKGILFIRLKGDLTKLTYQSLNDYLIPIIYNNGIKYVVYNLEKINNLDCFGRLSLKEGYTATKRNNGTCLICGKQIYFNDEFKTVKDELEALRLIKI